MGAGRRIPNKFPMPRIGILNLWAWNVSGRGGPLADDQINSSFVLRTSFLFSFFFPLFHHIHSISFCFFFRFCFFFFFCVFNNVLVDDKGRHNADGNKSNQPRTFSTVSVECIHHHICRIHYQEASRKTEKHKSTSFVQSTENLSQLT